jgi:hypothetical protein
MASTARHGLVVVAMVAMAACGRAGAPQPAAPSSAQLDKQAIEAATARERNYQAALAKGDLAYLDECATGATDSIRLVEVGADRSQGYSLAVLPDARGAVAIWQGLQHAGGGKYTAYGPQGMRLDGNGWRQLRQALVEPDFALHVEPVTLPWKPRAYPQAFIAYCLDGHPFSAAAPASADERLAFERTAVAMRKLGGNYYSPPAHDDE